VKLAALLFAAMMAIAALSFLVGRSGRLARCTDVPLGEAKSPDGRIVATRFEHACGDSAPATTQVALRNASDPFAPSETDVVLIAEGRVPVALSWRDDHTLLATTPGKILDRRAAWRSVSIVGTTPPSR
jgi:hypothetical protein